MKSTKHLLALFLVFTVATILNLSPKPAPAQELSGSDAGYIDGAVVQNQMRFRFDSAYDNPFPDRAEFFYPKCGCFANPPGQAPQLPESRVDYQEMELYFEKRILQSGWSGFVELPIRFINPEVNENHAGLGDVRAGFKRALIESDNRWLTFQLRGYFPSGDGSAGLGTEHVSLEPGLLFQRNDGRFSGFGEFKAWIPIDGSQELFQGSVRNFSGTVLRYGLGTSYDIIQQHCHFRCCNCDTCWTRINKRLSLVSELVGWTVLDGLKFRTNNSAMPADPAFFTFASAINDTIVNLKLGLRWTTPGKSVYVGYGTALTGDVWYKDIVRAEYTVRF